ncbi:MAG: asparaginase [Proteobacteria bacterium]|nr:asparaginase [Pseudomonadota bacterium]
MANPVLVEVTRGERVESVHRGAIAIARADGRLAFALGDVETPVYSRSSLKPIQALPLVESGAADAFGLSDEEIALACASHSGEPMHTTRVAAWLSRIGCGENDLACGAHPARYEPVWEEMVKRGEKPTRIHNNCSGKHTGFLTVARHWDVSTQGYEHHDHPVQKAVEKTLLELSGLNGALPWGVDGCAAPNFALPLSGFARALAKIASPSGLSDVRAKACRRIVQAMMDHPELVSGTGRVCATFMQAANKRAAVKTGAEGFFAGIVPEMGLGIALKIDDGAGRGAETAMAAILAKLKLVDANGPAGEILRAPVTNTRGKTVGERRPAPALAEAMISI